MTKPKPTKQGDREQKTTITWLASDTGTIEIPAFIPTTSDNFIRIDEASLADLRTAVELDRAELGKTIHSQRQASVLGDRIAILTSLTRYFEPDLADGRTLDESPLFRLVMTEERA